MTSLLIKGFIRFLFILVPAALALFYLYYRAGLYMTSHGMRSLVFLVGLAVFLCLLYLAKLILADVLRDIRKARE